MINMASRRGYLTQDELEEFAEISVTDGQEADDQISQAEEMIDAYVGPQEMFFPNKLTGKAQSGSTTGFLLQDNHCNSYQINYFVGCEVEIIGGTGQGERKKITASTYAGQVTTDSFSATLDNTSVYRIYQLGKFPRLCDAYYDNYSGDNKWYKQVIEAVKRATAAQVQYIIEMGDQYFSTDAADKLSESIGDYSYSKRQGIEVLIAPKAKALLRGIVNRTGQIIT